MRQKGLTAKSLSEKCKVNHSYISRAMRGGSGNISVKTLVMLAKGLEVNAHELFTAASGVAPEGSRGFDVLHLIDLMQRLLTDPRGLEVLEQWLRLSPGNQARLLEFIEFLNEQQPKAKRGKGKPRRK
jgi:transcriptional regulator with XRE-family HTH domain